MAKKKSNIKAQVGLTEEEALDLDSSSETESEEDLTNLEPSLLSKAVVFGTDWTAGTLIDQLRRGNIDLDPIFQRRDAWTPVRKSRFVESIILGLPIPQIVLAESKSSKGTFLVIDGKQRLLTLQQFAGVRLRSGATPLVLTNLSIREELNDKSYADLQTDVRLARHLNAFENQPIRTVVVKNWQKEEVLYLIFHRLNKETLPLSPQELRQAFLPGPFLKFAAEYTETKRGLHRALGIDRPDFRMRDVELLVRYYAFQHSLGDYTGNLKEFLDTACKLLNKEWADKEDQIKAEAAEMEEAIEATFIIFGSDAFRKWDGESYQSRFNRAVFDVMTYFFAQGTVRRKALSQKQKVTAAYQRLCEQNSSFVRAIETTTKSRKATQTRFTAWKQQLEKTLKIKTRMPALTSAP